MSLPLGPWVPDRGRFDTTVLNRAINVVPAVNSWKPLPAAVLTPPIYDYLADQVGNLLTDQDGNRLVVAPDWSGFSGSATLPADCTGLFAAKKKDGSEVLFAGTATGLYKFRTDQFVWEDVSSTTYASACRWSFAQFGTVVYVQNGFNTEQMFDVESDTVFSDNATAPICKYLCVVGNFLFRFNIVSWASEGYTSEPAMVQCSALEDPTDNVPYNANFCDFQVLPTGTEIMGAIAVTGGCHIWLKGALYSLTITLTEFTFTTAPLTEMKGTTAPYSIGLIGQDDYIVYADDGFWRYTGGFNAVGSNTVNEFFLDDCDQNARGDILACVDPENLVCWFAYTNTSGDRVMIGLQYVIGQFTQSNIAVQASARARTFTYTASTPPIVTEDLLRFAVIVSRQLGYLVGDPAEATFKTNEVLRSDLNRAIVNGMRLVSDAVNYSTVVTTTDVLGGTPRVRDAASPSERTGFVPVRANGRTHQYEVTIPASEPWTVATEILEIDAVPAGKS